MAAPDGGDIHADMVFKLSQRRSPSEVKLKSLEWAIVTQLDGEKTVGQIGEILSLNAEEARAMFRRLRSEELLDLVGTVRTDPVVPEDLLEEIEYQFTYVVGPVASVVMDDIIEDMQRARGTLERRQLPLLVELIALEISDGEKRRRFQRQIFDRIKSLF